jgi:hypothetical protein
MAPVHAGISFQQGLDRQRGQVVGTYAGETAAIAAYGSPDGVTDKSLVHERFPMGNKYAGRFSALLAGETGRALFQE